jgi:hypothetical protein
MEHRLYAVLEELKDKSDAALSKEPQDTDEMVTKYVKNLIKNEGKEGKLEAAKVYPFPLEEANGSSGKIASSKASAVKNPTGRMTVSSARKMIDDYDDDDEDDEDGGDVGEGEVGGEYGEDEEEGEEEEKYSHAGGKSKSTIKKLSKKISSSSSSSSSSKKPTGSKLNLDMDDE